jgi:hypothetical protein
MSVDAIIQQIQELSESERDQLFDRLDVLFGPPDDAIELSEETRKLLAERDAEYEANPEDGCSWKEVVAFVKRQKGSVS